MSKTDMTTVKIDSKPLFSGRELAKIIVPLIIQQLLAVLVGAVDTMMVSFAGDAAVSGVSLVNSLDTVLVIFFTSMTAGGSVVVAQLLGKKNGEEVNEAAKQLVYISTILALILTAAVVILRRPLLSLLFGDAQADVMAAALDYCFYVSLSFPLLAISGSIGAVFRVSGNSAIELYSSLLINVINIGGNAWFIIGMGMGAKGAAISTLISRAIGAAVMLVLIFNKKRAVRIENILKYKPRGDIIKRIMRIGVPNGIENTMFQFGRLLTQSLISTMGTAVIAANAVALTISGFQYTVGTACSSTMIAVVGRCLGAKEFGQAKRYSLRILLINYIALWTVILGTLTFLTPFVSLYDISPESIEIAKKLIVYHALVAAAIWPIGFMLPSCFRAAGDVNFTLVISMLSMWIFRVAGGYVMALPSVSVLNLFTVPGLGMGVMGVWIAMTVDWVFRVALFLWRYLSGRWLSARVSKDKSA